MTEESNCSVVAEEMLERIQIKRKAMKLALQLTSNSQPRRHTLEQTCKKSKAKTFFSTRESSLEDEEDELPIAPEEWLPSEESLKHRTSRNRTHVRPMPE